MNGMPGFNASLGLGVAHDTLEHFAREGTGITAEILAFGAMLYIRAEGGYFYQMDHMHPDPVYHMSADLGRFIAEIVDGQHSDGALAIPPSTRRLDSEIELTLSHLLAKAMEEAKLELNGMQDLDFDDITHDAEIAKLAQHIGDWMRRGYRRAIKRYPHSNADELSYLFSQIKNKVDREYNQAEIGTELVVRVDPRNLDFELKLNYPSCYY
jgi:hypothetical protein